MKICATTCLHNFALGMIGGSLDKERFPRNTEEQGKKAASLTAKLKAHMGGEQAKLGVHFIYVCPRVSACVSLYVSHTRIRSDMSRLLQLVLYVKRPELLRGCADEYFSFRHILSK